jgi:hypothetical protein
MALFALVLASRLHFIIPDSTVPPRSFCYLIYIVESVTILFSLSSFIANLLAGNGPVTTFYRIYKIVLYFEIGFVLINLFLELLYVYYFWQYVKDSHSYASAVIKKDIKKLSYAVNSWYYRFYLDFTALILLRSKIILVRFTLD